MSSNQETTIWRNIGAIPAAFIAWFVVNWVVAHFVLNALMGEDRDRAYCLFIIPVEPVAIWAIPILQSMIVPGSCVAISYYVATTKQSYFAVVTATILVMLFLAPNIFISFSPMKIEREVLFKSWLFCVISIASVAYALFALFEEYNKQEANK